MSNSDLETPDENGFDDDSVEPGVWRYARADRASVIVDAEDYFALMQQAMLKARHRIMLVGWDFDTRIHLTLGRKWFQRPFRRKYPRRLGSFLMWLGRHHDGLEIRILKWSLGVFQFLTRGYMLVDIARMASSKAITFKFDTHHPVGCSHHQKIAVLDDKLAVCGGIDMTQDRWDTREHQEKDRRRRRPHGRKYGPWHDATMMLEGDAARMLGELSRERWERAGGEPLRPPSEIPEKSLWPDKLPVQFENVELGIARTRAKHDGFPQINEIEQLTLGQIAAAKKFIYCENQYLTSRKIAEAIGARLKEELSEIVIVHPVTADGWLEQQAMDHARNCLVRGLVELDHAERFGLYVPYTGETTIYVHAKLMIVDDRVLRIGSANLNNRSMGLDSECDVFIDCDRPGNAHACDAIGELRCSLLGEHCGLEPERVRQLLEDDPSMIALIARHGRGGSRSLRPFELPEVGEIEATLAGSQLLDPERPEDMFEPFANGGLFRKGSLLRRAFRRSGKGLKR